MFNMIKLWVGDVTISKDVTENQEMYNAEMAEEELGRRRNNRKIIDKIRSVDIRSYNLTVAQVGSQKTPSFDHATETFNKKIIDADYLKYPLHLRNGLSAQIVQTNELIIPRMSRIQVGRPKQFTILLQKPI